MSYVYLTLSTHVCVSTICEHTHRNMNKIIEIRILRNVYFTIFFTLPIIRVLFELQY